MAITEIIQFPSLEGHTPIESIDKTVQKIAGILWEVKYPKNFVLGRQVQDKGVIQITAEWDGVQDPKQIKTTPEFKTLIKSISNLYGEPSSIFHVSSDCSPFGPDGPATANVVEYVQSYFPVSRVTPEFKKQVEDDFLKFDEIFSKGAIGGTSWISGWTLEEIEHEDAKGEKTKGFIVIRGWESIDQFQDSIHNEAYGKAIPLLLAWKVPFKMWHVERSMLDQRRLPHD